MTTVYWKNERMVSAAVGVRKWMTAAVEVRKWMTAAVEVFHFPPKILLNSGSIESSPYALFDADISGGEA